MNKQLGRCKQFLLENGWKLDADESYNGYYPFYKQGFLSIDISEDELVFIGDSGDFLHRPIDYYTLVGVLLEHRQLPINYKSV